MIGINNLKVLLDDFNGHVASILQLYSCTIDFIRVTHKCMSSTTHSTRTTQRTTDFRQKYKTERCRYWYDRGWCPFHDLCAFAHAESELRDKHALNQQYKTRICTNFKDHGFCKYGERCQFLHLNEAPTVLSRPNVPSPLAFNAYDQKMLPNKDKNDQEKHQKDIKMLANFGLEILNIKKQGHWDKWRVFVEQGPEAFEKKCWEETLLRAMDFQSQFPDYNFSRKPRLGSL